MMKMKINMNIRNAFGRLCIPILALGVFSASCTKELSSEVVPGGGGKGGESEVTLKLQVPGTAAGAKTRAVTEEEENKIDDLYVLAFKVDKDDNQETFDYYVAAKKQSTQGPQGDLSTWTASLKVKDYQQTFVMIANAQGTTGKVNEQIAALAGSSVGHSKMQMLAKLTETLNEDEKTQGFNAASDTNHHPFTMYGQTKATTITEKYGHSLTVSMHRIMAQVQVTFTGDAADNAIFEAENVLLYNFNDRARVIPDKLGVTGKDYVNTPTIPQGAVLLPAKADGKEIVPTYAVDAAAKNIAHAIYLFETAQPKDGTEKHVKRPCLIVQGKYKQENTSCYYRVDLATTDAGGIVTYMDVKRNHSYNVTISKVTGRGHDSPQKALESKPANITATVVAWNVSEMDNIDFDGQRVLGIGTMKYQLGKRGGNELLQQVKASKGLAWTATLYAADDYGQATTNVPDWIKFVDKDGTKTQKISGVGTNALEDCKFNVQRNDQVPERRAVMRFTAGKLNVDALVVQDQSNPVYINVKMGGKVITEAEFEQLGGWCDNMTIEYGPENTDLTWRYNGRGLELSQTDVGAGATADMEGTASSVDVEDAVLIWKGEAKALAGVDAMDYATKDGVLTLIAKGKQGMEAKSIRLFQKKYGVTLENEYVHCTGKISKVRVRGNMPWTAEMNAQNKTDAVANGYLKSVARNWSGYNTDEFLNGIQLDFNTARPNYKEGPMTATIIFKHAAKDNVADIVKTIELKPCLVQNNDDGTTTFYDVFGPVSRSYNDRLQPYTDDSGKVYDGTTMVNDAQAKLLIQNGAPDIGMTKDTQLTCAISFDKPTSQTKNTYDIGNKNDYVHMDTQNSPYVIYQIVVKSNNLKVYDMLYYKVLMNIQHPWAKSPTSQTQTFPTRWTFANGKITNLTVLKNYWNPLEGTSYITRVKDTPNPTPLWSNRATVGMIGFRSGFAMNYLNINYTGEVPVSNDKFYSEKYTTYYVKEIH